MQQPPSDKEITDRYNKAMHRLRAFSAGPRLTFGVTGREAVTIELPLPLASELLASGGVLRLDLEARAALSWIIKHEREEVERMERWLTATALERRLP